MKKIIFIALCLFTVAVFGQVGAPEMNLVLVNNAFYEFPKNDPDGKKTILPSGAEIVPSDIADKIKALTLDQVNDSNLNAIGIPAKYADIILGIKKTKPKTPNQKNK